MTFFFFQGLAKEVLKEAWVEPRVCGVVPKDKALPLHRRATTIFTRKTTANERFGSVVESSKSPAALDNF